jgi:putative DNA primase/helicase
MEPKLIILNEDGSPFLDNGRKSFIPWSMLHDEEYPNVAAIVPNGVVAVDVDNHGESDNVGAMNRCLLELGVNTLSYETQRGKHYWFEKPKLEDFKTDYICKLGIPLEIKKPGMQITIKKYGKVRKGDLKSKLEQFPKALLKSDTAEDCVDAKKGDGRHNLLLKISPEFKDLVNQKVFKKPKPQQVVDGMMPQEKEANYKSKNGKVNLNLYAIHLVKILDIHMIGLDTFYKLPKDNEWLNFSDNLNILHQYIIYDEVGLTRANRSEVIETITQVVEQTEVYEYPVHLNNVTLYRGEVILERQDYMPTRFTIKRDYDANAYDEKTDVFLRTLAVDYSGKFSKEIYNALLSILGHMLITRFDGNNLAIILTVGTGRNGKSTFQQLLSNMLPTKMAGNLKLEQLAKEFLVTKLSGKLVNIGDDIENRRFNASATLKSISASEPITVNIKGKEGIEGFKNSATLIMSANEVPYISDTSDGMLRRMFYIPFNLDLKNNPQLQDPTLKYHLTTESSINYVTKLAVESYTNVYHNGIEKGPILSGMSHEQHILNDSVFNYFDIKYSKMSDEQFTKAISNRASAEVYTEYHEFCKQQHLEPKHASSFGKLFKNIVTSTGDLTITTKPTGGIRKYYVERKTSAKESN